MVFEPLRISSFARKAGLLMNILVVEDDIRLSNALAHILEENGYHVDVVHDGQSGVDYGSSQIYDVIILDVMLPKLNGYAVTTALRRAQVSTPILLLTARDSTADKITGLDSGADDYMTKPFSPAELMAHLRALTRRQGDILFERLTAGDLTLDLESYDLSRGLKTIHLSFKEFSICKILMANPGQVISKDTLITKAWGIESNAGDNNVEAYISFLRKKLNHLGSSARIETIRKAGYRLAIEAGSVSSEGCASSEDGASGDGSAHAVDANAEEANGGNSEDAC